MKEFFELGKSWAASNRGVSKRSMLRKQAFAETIESPEGVPMHRELCKIAAAAFQLDGDPGHPAAILFDNLSKEAHWYPEYNKFTNCVLRALSRCEEMQKDAAALLPIVASLHDKAGGGVLKTLTAAGALGGASLGSLAYLASRNARQSSAENAALLEKVRAYKKLRKEIEEDMASNRVMETDVKEEPVYNV